MTCKNLGTKPSQFDGFWASVSKIKVFKDCTLKYKYSYIDKLPKKTWDFHIFGKFNHKVLELFHLSKINGYTGSDNDLMTISFKEALKKFKLTPTQKKESFEVLNKYLQKLAHSRVSNKVPNVIGVEDSFYVDIAGKVLLHGVIDLVQHDPDGVLHVGDYKTSKEKKYLKEDDFQLKTYAYVKCIQDPSVEKVRVSYIMMKHNFDYITFEYKRDEIMNIEQQFLDYAEEIQREALFRPSPSPLCPFCDYLEFCEEGQSFVEERNNKKTSQTQKRSNNWGENTW